MDMLEAGVKGEFDEDQVIYQSISVKSGPRREQGVYISKAISEDSIILWLHPMHAIE